VVDFELSEEEEAVRDLTRSIGVEVVSPEAKQAEIARGVPERVWRQLIDTGLVAPAATQHGGGGLPDTLSQLLAAEGLAYGDAAIAAAAFWSGNAAVMIGLCGDPEQQARLLPRLTSSSARFAVAYSEGYGRSPSEYTTTIRKEGDRWRITGTKVAVPFGPEAEAVVVVGIDPSSADRIRTVEDHIGLATAPLSTVSLDISVDQEQILGGQEADPDHLARAVARIRLINAAIAVGCAQRAREYASKYATEREAFGRPISAFQGVAFMMADAQMQIDAARLQVWHSASELEDLDGWAVERSVSAAVTYATSVAAAVTRDSVQVLGGHGFIADHPVERWYRAAAGLATLDTDPLCGSFAPAL
jgi:alkylation response protein AidB-like acyl-CoA dehydrogenase